MVVFPPGKINIGLQVVSKRSDGYHDLITAFVPLPLTDILEIIPAPSFSFSLTGIAVPGSDATNLCVKAYDLLKRDLEIPPVAIHLHKIVPVGAGLGGGSSDATHTLLVLNELMGLRLTGEKLKAYALALGSDCPFFLEKGPRLGKGRGELLEPLDLSLAGMFLVVVKPEIHISTAEAFAGLSPGMPEHDLKYVLENLPPRNWKDHVRNDFEVSIFRKHPEIAVIKTRLYESGAVYASLSGSGSSLFGLFSSPVEIGEQFPGCFYWSGVLN